MILLSKQGLHCAYIVHVVLSGCLSFVLYQCTYIGAHGPPSKQIFDIIDLYIYLPD